MNSTQPALAPPVDHYENFPVASWLCPTRLRPAITAIYWFARVADDLADEGDAPAAVRLEQLAQYRQDLEAVANQLPASDRWPNVFKPLERALTDYQLPPHLLGRLLDAFEQDVRLTADRQRYESDEALLDYCTRSANPVGRLLLHLYGISDERSLSQSDEICTALQLINFWQDLSIDVPRERWYPSEKTMHLFGVSNADLQPKSDSPAAAKMVAHYALAARTLMLSGAPLACHIPGRAGWELRLVVQGGLRILDKIESLKYKTWQARPKLVWLDYPIIIWRAILMQPSPR